MERMLKEKYKVGYVNGKLYHLKVNLVRYADDFIVTADKKEILFEIKGNVDCLSKGERVYLIRGEDIDNTCQ